MTIQPELFPQNERSQIEKTAAISKCGKYRYCLSRVWDKEKPKVLFIMLNPSTADSEKDDPTILRCIAFAKSWDFGSLYVINLYAFRATNPKDLLKATSIVGIDNEKWFKKMSNIADLIVGAWGNKAIISKINKSPDYNSYNPISWINKPLHYLELSKDGYTPKHPLYLKKDLVPRFHPIQHVPQKIKYIFENYNKFRYINEKIKKMSQPSKSIGSILIQFIQEFTTDESNSDTDKLKIIISTIKDIKTLIN